MNIIGHLTLRSLRLNRTRTAVTIVGVILSAAMITAVAAFSASFLTLMRDETIVSDGNWHAKLSGVRGADLPSVAADPAVGRVMLSRTVGYARLEGMEKPDKPYLYLRDMDAAALADGFPATLTAGRMPSAPGEIVLPEHLLKNDGFLYGVGDPWTLEVGTRVDVNGYGLTQVDPFWGNSEEATESLVDTRSVTYTIVGIIARPAYEPSWAPGYTVIGWLDAGAVGPEDTVDVYLRASRLNRAFPAAVTALGQRFGLPDEGGVSLHNELLRYYGVVRNDSTQRMINGFFTVIILIIMIASISLIYNAFAISVSERTRQLGMLASVGATKRQKRTNVYYEAALVGLIGVPAGIAAGLLGIGITIRILRPVMDTFMQFSSGGLRLVILPSSIGVAAGCSVLTIFLSAWIPAMRASRTMPIDAIRQSREVRMTARSVKTSRLTRLLFGFEGEIALKNLKRSRGKYRATVLSLVISLILFLTVAFYVDTSGRVLMSTSDGMAFDLAVYAYGDNRDGQRAMFAEIAGMDQAGDAVRIEYLSGSVRLDAPQLSGRAREAATAEQDGMYRFNLTVFGMDPASFRRYAAELGVDAASYEDPEHPRAILVNYGVTIRDGKRTAGEIVDLSPDTVLRFQNDTDPAFSYEIAVGKVTPDHPMGVNTSDLGTVTLVVDEAVFDDIRDTGPDAMRSNYMQLFVTTDQADELEGLIEDRVGSAGESYSVFNAVSAAQRERNSQLFLGVFIYGFIILISLICVANIFNTVSTNMALRRKEFAMLRSVGMTPGGFSRMIRFESLFYGLNALMYGIPTSVAVAYLLYRMQRDSFDFGFILPWESYGLAIVLILAIVTATMLYAGMKLKRENIVDALKQENQ